MIKIQNNLKRKIAELEGKIQTQQNEIDKVRKTLIQICQDGQNPKRDVKGVIQHRQDYQVEHPIIPIWTTHRKVSELIVSLKN